MSVSRQLYIEYALVNKLVHKWGWVTSMLGIHSNGYSNEYIKIDDNTGYVYMNDAFVELEGGYIPDGAFLRIYDTVTANSNIFKSLDKNTETILGKLFINYLLIEYPFNGTIPYNTGGLSIDDIIATTKDALSDNKITVSEYRDFVTACTYLEEFNKLVTPASTAKLLVPPPGLKKFKSELRDTLVVEYGNDWSATPANVVEYDTKLKEYYEEYISDDPSNGVVADKKTKNNALAKKFLTFSTTNAFGEQVHIEEPLIEGYPKDPDKLTAMFNTIRHASYARGNETQKGGGVAKSVLRATNSISIVTGDCGVKYGKTLLVTEQLHKGLVGRYIIISGKPVVLSNDNVSSYVGKVVELRSPTYCKTENPNRCSICMGDKASGYPNGVSLIVTNISSVLTLSSLKVMHNNQLSAVKVDLGDMVS